MGGRLASVLVSFMFVFFPVCDAPGGGLPPLLVRGKGKCGVVVMQQVVCMYQQRLIDYSGSGMRLLHPHT